MHFGQILQKESWPYSVMSVFGCTQFQIRHFYGGSPSSSVCGNQCVFQIGQKPLLWLHFQCAAECVVEHGGKLSLIIESAAFSVKCVLLHRGVGLADFLSATCLWETNTLTHPCAPI